MSKQITFLWCIVLSCFVARGADIDFRCVDAKTQQAIDGVELKIGGRDSAKPSQAIAPQTVQADAGGVSVSLPDAGLGSLRVTAKKAGYVMREVRWLSHEG